MRSFILNKIIPILVVLCFVNIANGQTMTISGDASVNQNDTESYHAQQSRGVTVYSGTWEVFGATITTSTKQDATIQWTTSGNKTILYTASTSQGTLQATYSVTVAAVTAPNAPGNPSILTQNCTTATLQKTGTIPGGNQWYWQGTNSAGTSTTNAATSTYPVTASGTYYIRAQDTSTLLWSASSGSVTVTLGVIGGSTWYADTDGDSLGDPASSMLSCSQPSGYVSNSNDLCPGTYGLAGNSGCPLVNASSNENYIYTIVPQIKVSSIGALTDDDHSIRSINYFDGLGRAKQQIAIQAGNAKKDIVTHIAYDSFGRQVKNFLPYASTNLDGQINSGAESATATFYNVSKYDNTTNPYSEKDFEGSPLNRVLKQAAPGYDWRLTGGNEIEFEYDTNAINVVKRFDVGLIVANNTYTPALAGGTTHYAAGELSKTIVKDENHTGSSKLHTSEEFKNKQGQVLLKRTYATVSSTVTAHDTYYVYDIYGNLSYVLPPKMDVANATLATITGSLDDLAYQYVYDHRNRLIEKKIPGKGWEHIVYDSLDRPVLTQDAVQRPNKEWLFTKYDELGRVAYTGLYTYSVVVNDQHVMQTHFNSQYVSEASLYESKVTSGTGYSNSYYNNGDFPSSGITLLTINYYDDYSFDLAGSVLPGFLPQIYGKTITSNVTGLATGSRVKVLGTANDWITTISYYDDKARAIYVYAKNSYLNTTDTVKSDLNFTARLDETTSTHTNANNSDPTIETKDEFIYDHVGRLKTQTQTIAGVHAAELIVSNTYDNLGQLVSKDVGNTDTKPLQTIDYTYNIRGWLQGINNEGGSNSGITLGSDDLFGFQINYNDPSTGTGLFNGNIKQTLWKTTSTNPAPYNPVSNMYTYTYDALNRITDATDNTTNYNVHDITYDRNGNLITLKREGKSHAVNNTFSIMDNLSYTYTVNGIDTNQLQSVNDSSGSTEGFNNGATSSVEYTYDANGNMITDANKGITAISYNHLNLPTQVTLASGNIQYIYDAVGTKLRKIVSSGATTNYAGNYIYEGSSLKFFNHGEGYIEPDGSGGYEYVYQYIDHLGNIRLSYKNIGSTSTPSLQIQEENNYYPFGLKHKGYNGVVNGTNHKYGFGDKEEQDELGLGWIDITARNYDAALGRWMNLDPLAEMMRRHSPYNYAFDNPVFFIDPDGQAPRSSIVRSSLEARDSAIDREEQDKKYGNDSNSDDDDGTSKESQAIKKEFWAASKRFDDPPNNGDGTAGYIPAVGPLLRSGDRLAEGNYLGAIEQFGWALIDVFSLGLLSGGSTAGKYISSEIGEQISKNVIAQTTSLSFYSNGSGRFYSVAFEMKLSKSLYPGGSYYSHFKAANRALISNMDTATMNSLNIQLVKSKTGSLLLGRSPKNWVWHHDIKSGVMQLVPKTQHTSGSLFWRNLHPNGVGGMKLWN